MRKSAGETLSTQGKFIFLNRWCQMLSSRYKMLVCLEAWLADGPMQGPSQMTGRISHENLDYFRKYFSNTP